MKVMLDGKEIELEELEAGAIEVDKLTSKEKIDMEDTLEVTEEMLKKIKKEMEKNHE